MTGWHVGDTLRHTSTGKLRRVVRITPAGSAGTRVSDGPVWHARVVDENGDDIPGGHTADIWRGSLSYPAADWQRVDVESSASRQWWIESGRFLADGDDCGCLDHPDGVHRF